MQSVWCVFTGL